MLSLVNTVFIIRRAPLPVFILHLNTESGGRGDKYVLHSYLDTYRFMVYNTNSTEIENNVAVHTAAE